MPDNKQLPATGTGTADIKVATDEIEDVDGNLIDYQYVKLADGTKDSQLPIEGSWVQGHFGLLVEDRALRQVLEQLLLAQVVLEGNYPAVKLSVVHDPPSSENWRVTHTNVSNSAIRIAPRTERRRITIVNTQSVIVYLGSTGDITASGAATLKLSVGDTVTIDTKGEIFGITTSPYTAADEDSKLQAFEEY